jgi:hypothetical protein
MDVKGRVKKKDIEGFENADDISESETAPMYTDHFDREAAAAPPPHRK